MGGEAGRTGGRVILPHNAVLMGATSSPIGLWALLDNCGNKCNDSYTNYVHFKYKQDSTDSTYSKVISPAKGMFKSMSAACSGKVIELMAATLASGGRSTIPGLNAYIGLGDLRTTKWE